MTSDAVPTAGSSAAYRAARGELIADTDTVGRDLRRALTALTDDWLAEVCTMARQPTDTSAEGIALLALGGYGRGELWPGSDLDLTVVHRNRADDAARIAEAVWYRVWDTGVQLGHSVRSIDEAVAVVGDDIESSTALLDARLVAGDVTVATELSDRVAEAWADSGAATTRWLHVDAAARHERLGDVAFALEPNLKNAGGGLRDAQIPAWLAVGGRGEGLGSADRSDLADAQSFLGDVRLALHRCAPTSGDVLHLQDQDAVAAMLHVVDADELMSRVAAAGRVVSWVLEEAWLQAGDESASTRGDGPRHGLRRFWTRNDDDAGAQRSSMTGEELDATDPVAVLRHAADRAGSAQRMDRTVLADIAAVTPRPGEPWDSGLRDAFVELLASGPGMIRVVESLDHVGVWERFVPEWSDVRSRAQRTPYHRYTVDRHLLETVANVAALGGEVDRPDLLVVAALLHDLGKAHDGDHSEVGVQIAEVVAPRMGFDSADVDVLCSLVAHHLLLPEVATRRDLDDPATIDSVAATIGSVELLELLSALCEADALATGPAAWSDWKAGLVHTLVDRVRAHLVDGETEPLTRTFPSPEQQELLDAQVTSLRGDARTLTVVAPDRPRLFSRVTGALVLAGLDVTAAEVTSAGGMALEVFTVAPAFARDELAESFAVDWPKVTADVERALSGRVAIAARVAARAVTYRQRPQGADDSVRVRFDDFGEDSGASTVVEIDAPDRIGVLFAITRALSDLDVDVRYARIETRADRVTDAFSILDSEGAPIRDEAFRAEITQAIHYALET